MWCHCWNGGMFCHSSPTPSLWARRLSGIACAASGSPYQALQPSPAPCTHTQHAYQYKHVHTHTHKHVYREIPSPGGRLPTKPPSGSQRIFHSPNKIKNAQMFCCWQCGQSDADPSEAERRRDTPNLLLAVRPCSHAGWPTPRPLVHGPRDRRGEKRES